MSEDVYDSRKLEAIICFLIVDWISKSGFIGIVSV